MSRVRFLLSVAIALPFLNSIAIEACGDKYLRLASRLGPAYSAAHPAKVLIFMPETSVVPDVAKSLNLHGGLRNAGHTVSAVRNELELERALAADRYDIVIADAFAPPSVAAIVQGGSGRPTLVPAFSKKSHRQTERTDTMPLCRISAKDVQYHAIGEIDHVMDLRKSATVVP